VPLDPHLQAMLGLMGHLGQPPLNAGTPEQARRALRTVTVDVRLLNAKVPVGQVNDQLIRVGGIVLPIRIYRPAGPRTARRPTIVYFHGGGFVIGDLDTHDDACRWLCREVDAVVVAVGYRTAPESPFPAAVEDALAATRWVVDRTGRLGGDRRRVVVAGDSSGGNLATVVAQAWHDEVERPPLAAQLLIYPVTDLEDEGGVRYPSRAEHAEGYLLTGDDLRWFAGLYLGDNSDRGDPRLSPINGPLTGLPPAVVVTAEFDPLRDEAEAYAAALSSAGVPVTVRRFDGLIHGFFALAALAPACTRAVRTTCALLRETLETTS
jgi:acetyl esterase